MQIEILERSSLFSYYMYSHSTPHMCRTQIGINVTLENRNLVLLSLTIPCVCNVLSTAFISFGTSVGNFCEAAFSKAILGYCFVLLWQVLCSESEMLNIYLNPASLNNAQSVWAVASSTWNKNVHHIYCVLGTAAQGCSKINRSVLWT